MANLAYNADVQDQVAHALMGNTYASLSIAQRTLIDGNVTNSPPAAGRAQQAWVRVNQLAQWSELAGATANSDLAEPWLVTEIVYLCAPTLRPERIAEFRQQRDEARATYLDSVVDAVGTTEITTGYDAKVFTPTLEAFRYYVLRYCTKMDKPFLPSPATIDAAAFARTNWLWNKSPWSFRRRKLSAVVGVTSVTAGTWVESTKTLTQASAFAAYPYTGAGATTSVDGATFTATGGTSTVLGTSLVATKVSASAITLSQSISKIAADLTAADIAGKVVSVRVFGLQSGDRLDAINTRKLYVDGQDDKAIVWATGDEYAQMTAYSAVDPDVPRRFRIERQGQTLVWFFWPLPDADYTIHFDGLLCLPGTTTAGVPTSAIDTTVWSKFPQEFKSVLKDLILGEVLAKSGKGDAVLKAAEDEAERWGKEYDDPGAPSHGGVIRDVYRDVAALGAGGGWGDALGGPM